MQGALLTIGIVLVILGVIGIIYAIRYNKIVLDRLKINEAEVNIDETLRKKYDDVVKCINAIESKTKKEVKIFESVKKIKSNQMSNFELDRLLTKAVDEITIMTEDYPKISETKGYNDLIKDIDTLEEHLVALRSYYNKYCFDFNKRIGTFPDTMIAKIHKFSEKPFYDGKNLNDEVYTDFKL